MTLKSAKLLIFPVLLLLLLLMVGLAEVLCRVIGVGHQPSFLIREFVSGQPVWESNPHFSDPFYPKGLARPPLHIQWPYAKPKNALRIVVVGGSAAQGDPNPAFGLAPILQCMVDEVWPDVSFQVVNAGLTAANSHVVREVVDGLSIAQPDIVIVYMGNNEALGPFGPAGRSSQRAPSLGRVRATIALRQMRLGQLFLPRGPSADSWRGLAQFAEHELDPTSISWHGLYTSFEKNLGAVISACHKMKAMPLVCTVPASLQFGAFRGATLENDQLRFRADERIQEIIHESDATIISAMEAVRKEEEQKGFEAVFHDHVHLTFHGTYLVAKKIFPEIKKLLDERGLNDSLTVQVPSEDTCKYRLVFNPPEELTEVNKMLQRYQRAPFIERTNNIQDLIRLQKRMDLLKNEMAGSGGEASLLSYHNVLQDKPSGLGITCSTGCTQPRLSTVYGV